MPDIVGTDTLLEGDLPDTAANYSSLAAHAAKTEEDWDAELRGAEETRWGDGVLGGLFEGLAQGKPFVAALIEAILNEVFDDISETFDNVENAFNQMASSFSGKWRDIKNAKDAADFANAQLAVSNRPIRDLFDGAEGDLSADWDADYYDSVGGLAAGEVQQDGNGNAWWDGFGVAARGVRCRFTALDTTTDLQTMTMVMPLAVQEPPLLGQQSHMRFYARMNSTSDDYVYADITNDSVSLGYAVGGSETEWATTGTATQDGDVWDFTAGTAGNSYYFFVERNGITVVDYDDTANDSEMDASHRSVGFGMYAASRGLGGQTSPGTIAVFSADDN